MHASNYPSATLFRQMLAYFEVCAEAINEKPCDLFIDTVGVGFAYVLVSVLYGRRIMSYTHYPTISSDMLKQIDTNQFNNQFANSGPHVKFAKRIYYHILTIAYKLFGSFADQVATNSSWTDGHIRELWGDKKTTKLIYPPCDTNDIIA